MNEHPSSPLFHRSDGRALVIVHGGAEARSYRNVLEALDTALAVQADYFEFDVRRTADGVLVVHHDKEMAAAKLCDLSYADAARAAATIGYELPRLESILRRAHGAIRLDVELKETGYEEAVLQALRSGGFHSHAIVVTSFEQSALNAIHAADPNVATGLLVYDVTGPEALELFRRSRTKFLGPDHAILDVMTLHEADVARIPLVPWTVNDANAMERLLRSAPVIGLITDDPVRAVNVRGRLAPVHHVDVSTNNSL